MKIKSMGELDEEKKKKIEKMYYEENKTLPEISKVVGRDWS